MNLNSETANKIETTFKKSLDNLHWKEDDMGHVYVSDSPSPKLIARLERANESVSFADYSDVNINWHQLTPM